VNLRTWLVIGCYFGALVCPSLAAQQAPSGTWIGKWERDGSILDVEVVFKPTDSGYSGTFSSEQLRTVGIPFEHVRYDAPRITWALAGDAATTRFDGKLQGTTLTGQFREGDATGTFRLTRAQSIAAAIQEQEISFGNGEVQLAGTVIYPAGPGPFPCVVLLHGSGAEARWASRYLATAFARNGIAALVYDKRGVGASTGDWRQAGFAELAGDASAAVEALRAWPGIDSGRIGLHGHSQGAMIVAQVASDNPHVAFVIGSAATGVSMAETEVYSLGNAIGVSRLPATEQPLAKRFIEAIVATAYGGAPRAQLENAWQSVHDRPWAFQPPPDSDAYWSFSHRIASYRPLDYWRQVAVPVLLVYGEDDARVPSRKSAAQIANAYLGGQGTQLEVRFFPAADHTLRLRPRTSGKFEWPRSAPGYPDVMIRWVMKITEAGGT